MFQLLETRKPLFIGYKAQQWKPTRKKSLFVLVKQVLSPVFRGKIMALLIQAFEKGELSFFGQTKPLEDMAELRKLFSKILLKKWVVFAKRPFGGPEQIINYLSRYTHRIAISNHRILALKDNTISFHYKNYKTKNEKALPPVNTLTINALEFLRRFLLHVLPRGFQRMRYYGFLATRNRKTKLCNLQKSLNYQPQPSLQITWQQRILQLTGTDPNACPFCQSRSMLFLGFLPRQPDPGRSPRLC